MKRHLCCSVSQLPSAAGLVPDRAPIALLIVMAGHNLGLLCLNVEVLQGTACGLTEATSTPCWPLLLPASLETLLTVHLMTRNPSSFCWEAGL